MFFIDHQSRQTTWEDPRINKLMGGGPAVPYSRDYKKKYEFFRNKMWHGTLEPRPLKILGVLDLGIRPMSIIGLPSLGPRPTNIRIALVLGPRSMHIPGVLGGGIPGIPRSRTA